MKHENVDQAVGYAIKRAQSALRSALDRELRGLNLTVPQYSCLEQLSHRPGRSNADLARGAFVTRQAMHQLLGGMLAEGLVVGAGTGRDTRFRCTTAGERVLTTASDAVAAVEDRMLTALSADARKRLLRDLTRCVDALSSEQPHQGK